MFAVERYRPALRDEWDDFVRASRNGTFLFQRDYMDYHADRFDDASLVVRDAKDDVAALLPGNLAGNEYASHGGLTYGGLVVGPGMTSLPLGEVLARVVAAVFDLGVRRFLYKPLPHIYHRGPCEEDLWALLQQGARLFRRNVSFAIVRPDRSPVQERRNRGRKKALLAGVSARESNDWEAFWLVLHANLAARYGTRPVHALAEIRLLAARFPAHIRLFDATRDGVCLGGVVIFETDRVAHVQYVASTPDGRDVGALDLLFGFLVDTVYAEKAVFDFGTSMEPATGELSAGNAEFKEGFGARATMYDWYVLERT